MEKERIERARERETLWEMDIYEWEQQQYDITQTLMRKRRDIYRHSEGNNKQRQMKRGKRQIGSLA